MIAVYRLGQIRSYPTSSSDCSMPFQRLLLRAAGSDDVVEQDARSAVGAGGFAFRGVDAFHGPLGRVQVRGLDGLRGRGELGVPGVTRRWGRAVLDYQQQSSGCHRRSRLTQYLVVREVDRRLEELGRDQVELALGKRMGQVVALE